MGERSTPSVDEAEEWATAADATLDCGSCPTPGSSGIHRHSDHVAAPSRTVTAADAAREAYAFLATIINGNPEPLAVGALGIRQQRHQLDSWENYLERIVR